MVVVINSLQLTVAVMGQLGSIPFKMPSVALLAKDSFSSCGSSKNTFLCSLHALDELLWNTMIHHLSTIREEFLELQQEQKESYANNVAEGISQGYGAKLAYNSNSKLEWIDYYFHMLCRPNKNTWPERFPSICRTFVLFSSTIYFRAEFVEVIWLAYCRELTDEHGRELWAGMNTLLSALSLYLGLEERVLK